MRTRTALAGAAASAAWLSFATDALPARVAVAAVLALVPAVTVAGHLRSAGHRPRAAAVLALAAAAVTVLLVEDLAPRLGGDGGPALVAVVLALWTTALLRRPAGAAPAVSPADVLPLVPVQSGGPLLPAPGPVPRLAPDAHPSAPAEAPAVPAPVAAPPAGLPHAG
ncbi:hypothetical protein ACFEMC_08070 [Kineococcus sp. DHX-1]|uniref:hypothetical protein n=1 Tax=Kineococcus sp. DHX-1 TaxID=3349638 RepID=UPI0036D2358D